MEANLTTLTLFKLRYLQHFHNYIEKKVHMYIIELKRIILFSHVPEFDPSMNNYILN